MSAFYTFLSSLYYCRLKFISLILLGEMEVRTFPDNSSLVIVLAIMAVTYFLHCFIHAV